MASVFLFVFFALSNLQLLHSAEEVRYTQKCLPFNCGHLGMIGFPFAKTESPECGVFTVDSGDQYSTIQREGGGRRYEVKNISQDNTIRIRDTELAEHLNFSRCESLTNLTFPNSSFISFEIATPNQTLFKCKCTLAISPPKYFYNMSCYDSNIYFTISNDSFPTSLSGCSIILLTMNPLLYQGALYYSAEDLFSLLTAEFDLGVRISDECYRCYNRGGQRKPGDNGKLKCGGAHKVIDLAGITRPYLFQIHVL
jgi:hypothetical protein